MFVLDESADDLVRKQPKLQDVVHGRTGMAWLPGQTAGVGAQACLMFGAAGTGVSLLWLSTITVQHFLYFMIGACLFAAIQGLIFHAVLRGRLKARIRAYRFALTMLGLSACVVTACLIVGAKVPLGLALGGVVFNGFGARLIAGPSYALLSAIFRAQRAHLDDADSRVI